MIDGEEYEIFTINFLGLRISIDSSLMPADELLEPIKLNMIDEFLFFKIEYIDKGLLLSGFVPNSYDGLYKQNVITAGDLFWHYRRVEAKLVELIGQPLPLGMSLALFVQFDGYDFIFSPTTLKV